MLAKIGWRLCAKRERAGHQGEGTDSHSSCPRILAWAPECSAQVHCMDFHLSPLLVIWEVTQACDLACVHCRTGIRPERDGGELDTTEGRRLLEEIKQFGNPLMIFTGGDPLKRSDLYDLARYSVQIGLRTNITPSPTPLLTADAIDELKNSG